MSLPGINAKVLKTGDPEPPAPAPGTFRFYSMRFCPWAQRALIYAAKKGIRTEVVNIHLLERPEWYFNKHYKGQVPALEHDGRIVIESTVIPEYLDDLFTEKRILPADPYEKAQQKLLLDKLVVIAPAMYGFVNANSSEKLVALVKGFENAEHLLQNEFYSGIAPGFVDYLIYPIFQRIFWLAHVIVDFPFDSTGFPGVEKYPKLTQWYAKVRALPEIVATSQPTEAGVGYTLGYIEGTSNYDYGL